MFQQRDIVTAIEIGTSKICVLVGESTQDGKISVIGHGEAPSVNTVVKGEIADMDTALEQLTSAIEAADASSGREISNSNIIAVAVTGSSIQAYQGTGTVFVNSEDHRITESEMNEALQNAQVKPLPFGQTIINTFDSYYLLDGNRRVRNPFDQTADKLEAFIHVIHGDTNRIENFRSIMRDAGFEHEITPVFSGIASVYGILTDEEKEHGVLLVDMGAGTCEYMAVFNMGILASGVLPIGFEHVANDLSLGLDLHISVCRKMLIDGTIARHVQERQGFLELRTSAGNLRKIPLSSFEKIIDLRLREVFQIIHKNISDQGIFRNLSSGGVLTGGAALFPRTAEIFKSVFEFPVRVGQPFDASGAVTGLENPRYSTVWGVLKFGEELNRIINSRRKRGMVGAFIDGFDGLADLVWRTLSNLKHSIKI